MTPRPKNVTAVLRKVRDTLRVSQYLPMQAALASVNPIVRGWVNYLRVGNSSQAFHKVRYHVERKVRRFATKKSKRKGFGWKRWSSAVVYKTRGLFGDYHPGYAGAKARAPTERIHNLDGGALRGEPDAGNRPVRFDVAGAGDGVMVDLNGHEAGNGGHCQGNPAHHRAGPRPYQVSVVEKPLVVEGNVATAAACLAGVELAAGSFSRCSGETRSAPPSAKCNPSAPARSGRADSVRGARAAPRRPSSSASAGAAARRIGLARGRVGLALNALALNARISRLFHPRRHPLSA